MLRPPRTEIPPAKAEWPSFTAWTTRVSNPVRSPRSRTSASVDAQSTGFPLGVPADLYAFHHYTGNSIDLCITPVAPYGMAPGRYAARFHTPRARPPACALRPVNPYNAWLLCITAAAGTELAEPYSQGTVIIVPRKRSLQPEGRHPPRGVARSGLRPLTKIPCCCLP